MHLFCYACYACPACPAAPQGCTKSGILVMGLPANHRIGSQFLAELKAQPAKSNSQPAKKKELLLTEQKAQIASLAQDSQAKKTYIAEQQPAILTAASQPKSIQPAYQ